MATQLGETLKIGFASNTYTAHIMQDFDTEATGEEEIIRDEDGDTTTVVLTDPGSRISFNAIIKDAGSLTPPAIGDSVTINLVLYRTESASVSQTSGASRLSFTGIKEDSMTYT